MEKNAKGLNDELLQEVSGGTNVNNDPYGLLMNVIANVYSGCYGNASRHEFVTTAFRTVLNSSAWYDLTEEERVALEEHIIELSHNFPEVWP